MSATIIWAHGLEGCPQGSKVRALSEAGLDVEAADYNGLSLQDRITLLEQLTLEAREAGKTLVLAGSSYGGLAAAVVARRHPERFAGLLLCAPALGHVEPPVGEPGEHQAPADLTTVVIHGRQDGVCKIEESRRYAERSGPQVELIEVEDGHRLEGSLSKVVELARGLVERASTPA